MTESRNDGQTPPISGPQPEDAPDSSGPIPQVEGYEIAGPLGQGGMGTVWSAVQLSTRREVALKLLGKGMLGSEKDRARFEREVELTARLHHPNIAQVYDSGVHHGVYFYAMELIDGLPLDKYIEERGLTQRQLLELMRTVCLAVQHAHERGVIHRDLKPSNILVTPDGQPHVLDFGLAKTFLEGDWVLTDTTYGEAAGTPAYMSPEQAAGKLDQIDIRTDVYALGVVLFRLLTKQSPHDLSGSRYEVLRRIAEEEVRRPREFTKEVNRELEALVLKSLARDPKGRYPSAGALAQDIENYLTGEPLTARSATTMYFLRKRISKYRMPVAVGCLILALLIGMAVFGYIRIARERTRAVAAESLAVERLGSLQKEVNKARAVYDFLRKMLVWSHPLGISTPADLDRAAEEIETQFGDRPEVEAAVRTAVGQVYVFLGEPGDGETQFRRALEIRKRVLGEEHMETIESVRFLSLALGQGSKLEEWESLMRQRLEIEGRVLGPEHPDTLTAMYWLSVALWKKGKLDEAVEVLRRCLEISCRVLGEQHPDTSQSMVTFSFYLEQAGKLDDSEAGRRKLLAIHLGMFGEEHASTVGSMHWLAGFLERRGKLNEAVVWRKNALEILLRVQGEERIIRRDVFREEPPDAVGQMNRLAVVLWENGKLDEAEVMNRRILEIRRRVQGEEDPDTLWAMSNLALVLEERGGFDEAEALRSEELAIRKRLRAKKAALKVSAPEPVMPAGNDRSASAYEGFDGKLSLGWQIVRPDPSHFSLTKNLGTLTITTQDGGLSESSRDYENLFLIDCPVLAGEDFQLTTCISRFDPVYPWNQAGLICYNDDDDYLKFVYQWSDKHGGRLFTVDAETEGRRLIVISVEEERFEKVWLRVAKRGNRYAFSTSFDGETFLPTRYPNYDLTDLFQRGVVWGDGTVRQVGLIAMNGSRSTAPEVDASFDFFEARSLDDKADREDEQNAANHRVAHGEASQ